MPVKLDQPRRRNKLIGRLVLAASAALHAGEIPERAFAIDPAREHSAIAVAWPAPLAPNLAAAMETFGSFDRSGSIVIFDCDRDRSFNCPIDRNNCPARAVQRLTCGVANFLAAWANHNAVITAFDTAPKRVAHADEWVVVSSPLHEAQSGFGSNVLVYVAALAPPPHE